MPKLHFDRYELYQKTVQSPPDEIRFFKRAFRNAFRHKPKVFREDFCGAFATACAWVKSGKGLTAYAVDLDAEPLEWGRRNNLSKLSPSKRSLVKEIQTSVLNPKLPKADLICALNFSYFILKKRSELKQYFVNCFKTLSKTGLVVLDCIGGSSCQGPDEERRRYRGYDYFWELEEYNPIANEAQFAIHFKLAKRAKIKRVFTYDWRMWSIPEVRELLAEAGFKASYVYWEGTNSRGIGNGRFSKAEVGEPCETWIAYIVGVKK